VFSEFLRFYPQGQAGETWERPNTAVIKFSIIFSGHFEYNHPYSTTNARSLYEPYISIHMNCPTCFGDMLTFSGMHMYYKGIYNQQIEFTRTMLKIKCSK